ncbi:MAG: hypothetical protein ABIQ79_07170 [Nitrospiraceae bacterium]
MRGAVPVQNFPWPIIKQRLHPLDLAPRDLVEPSALGKELTQQANPNAQLTDVEYVVSKSVARACAAEKVEQVLP